MYKYRDGQYNVICDRCGGKYLSSQCKSEWNGLLVCKWCWEPRQPQDFVRGRRDRQRVSPARPEPTDTFIGTLTRDDI